MNTINESLKFYSSYFHGVRDIMQCKSAKQAALGALKIISGFTLVVPIIFCVGRLISQHKLHKLEKLCGRVSEALTTEDNSKKPTQKELIKFLSIKVLDQENSDFESAFKRLESTSQKTFFASMADKGVLVDSLACVPKDIREITIGFGHLPSTEMVDKTIEQLGKFKQLHTITFDLSQTTHYTRGIASLIQRSVAVIESDALFGRSSKKSFDLREDRVNVSGVSIPNNHKPASRIIHGVVYHLIKESALAKINFRFKLQPGELIPVHLINPSRLQKIPENYAAMPPERDPLNNVVVSKDNSIQDIWIANTGSGYFSQKL